MNQVIVLCNRIVKNKTSTNPRHTGLCRASDSLVDAYMKQTLFFRKRTDQDVRKIVLQNQNENSLFALSDKLTYPT